MQFICTCAAQKKQKHFKPIEIILLLGLPQNSAIIWPCIVLLVVLVGGVLGAQASHPTEGGREVLLLH